MFYQARKQNRLTGAISLAELIYHATVRNVRRSHGNALKGLGMEIFQTIIFIAAFYMMFSVLGMRGNAIRGDFLLYLMSGIFLFLTHTKAMGAIFGAEGPASPMMKHAPMNTIIAIAAAAFSTLYLQMLSMIVVLFGVHVLINPVVIQDPAGALAMFAMAWFSGISIGMVLLAVKPWAPSFTQILNQIYSRVNMIASGKMFVANMLPGYMISWFSWNPLFHSIDQARGFTFINYSPHYTSFTYPIIFSLIALMIGLMGEFYTRKHASVSWTAGR